MLRLPSTKEAALRSAPNPQGLASSNSGGGLQWQPLLTNDIKPQHATHHEGTTTGTRKYRGGRCNATLRHPRDRIRLNRANYILLESYLDAISGPGSLYRGEGGGGGD